MFTMRVLDRVVGCIAITTVVLALYGLGYNTGKEHGNKCPAECCKCAADCCKAK